MILSLCIITKGDEELTSLKKAVYSCISFVDSVYITTNSKEFEKTKTWCESEPKIEHSHLKWNRNFSEQRNFNFSQAREDTDYILWMDSDDVIVNPHLLRDIAKTSKNNGYDTVFFSYWYGAKFNGEPSYNNLLDVELNQTRERLIRPKSIMWKKRIHEVPDPIDNANFKYSYVKHSKEYPIAWLHLGASRDMDPIKMGERMKRNQELLELELVEEREVGKPDPRTILYLMKIYAESNDPETLEACVDLGHEYLSLSGWDQERGLCYQMMGTCAGKLGLHKVASKLLNKAIEEFPYARLPYLYLARAYFNLGNYRAMKHYMDIGVGLEAKNVGTENSLEEKAVYLDLLVNYYYHVEKDLEKAEKSAKKAYELLPENEDILERLVYIENQNKLNEASRSAHTIIKYFEDIDRGEEILPFINNLPKEMKRLPFCYAYVNKYKEPKVWGDREICYFANFRGEHFEKWDGNSLKTGIGGSETAVIRLSEEWTKLGYKVTVYGDPKDEVEINGVLYKPWYTFNSRDIFNIFIQWRSSDVVGTIKAKKILIDLHDVFVEDSHVRNINSIDRLMVKSNFHKEYAPSIPDKVKVVSNGIN